MQCKRHGQEIAYEPKLCCYDLLCCEAYGGSSSYQHGVVAAIEMHATVLLRFVL
jgi:hypothetical protein